MNSKKVLVIGASENTERYSNKAIHKLLQYQHEVLAIGLKEGNVAGVKIQKGQPVLNNIHTITLYIGPQHQPAFYDYIISLKPNRVIFNPGTENIELQKKIQLNNIQFEVACTLVMLSTGQF
jgi:predicted CoA-binding protein